MNQGRLCVVDTPEEFIENRTKGRRKVEIDDRMTTTSDIANRLERLPISWLHYRLLILNGFGWLFDALDVGIVTFVMAALAKDWKLQPEQLGLIGSAGLAGMFLGAAISGIVADYWGRKKVFQVTLLVFAVTTLLCAFAWNVTSMIVFRFLVGVGLGGELPVVSSLLSEFIPGKHSLHYS